MDPTVAPELLASPHDDLTGAMGTYYFFGDRWNTVVASAAMFLTIVNAGIIGLLAGAITGLADGDVALSVTLGIVAALLSVLIVIVWVGAGYRHTQRAHVPRYPTTAGPQGQERGS